MGYYIQTGIFLYFSWPLAQIQVGTQSQDQTQSPASQWDGIQIQSDNYHFLDISLSGIYSIFFNFPDNPAKPIYQ